MQYSINQADRVRGPIHEQKNLDILDLAIQKYIRHSIKLLLEVYGVIKGKVKSN